MKRMILAICLFAGVAWGQGLLEKAYRTNGLVNCRTWITGTPDLQLGFILAYFELMPYVQGSSQISKTFEESHTTNVEVAAGVTAICTPPENGVLPVMDAIALFSYKISGASKSQVEARTAEYRQTRMAQEATEQKKK